MKSKILFFAFLFSLFSCNPYKGFSGVNPKGMKKNKLPSTELREDYDKGQKRMQKKYQKEMKRRNKDMGTKPEK